MAKGSIAGATDYSNQSLNDIFKDLDNELVAVLEVTASINRNINKLKDSNYWDKEVLLGFKNIINYSLRHYSTTIEELGSIKIEMGYEVQKNHCRRLENLAEVAYKINKDIGLFWHREYEKKAYGNKDFMLVENIYYNTRDIAVNLLDLSNIAGRLRDFIGKKNHLSSQNDNKLLKILFLSSSPIDEDRIRVDAELRQLEEELESSKFRDNILFTKKVAVKSDTITKALIDENPNIVHFSGHGNFDGISVENQEGETVLFSTQSLERLFSLFKDSIKCIVLNSCYSEEQAKAISSEEMYVIGMNSTISDEAAIKFTIGFYQAIGNGREIEFAFPGGLIIVRYFEE